MADIAFLLLVFFLVATNIQQDYGISSNISKAFEAPDSITIKTTTLLINKQGKFQLNNEIIKPQDLSNKVSDIFDRQNAVKNVLVVKTDRDVDYNNFLAALNESKRAFKLFYEKLSVSDYGQSYYLLSDSLKLTLRAKHPVALAENVVDTNFN